MTTYKIGNAIVNVYGEVDRERIEKATIVYMKKVYRSRKHRKEGEQSKWQR